MPLAAALPAIAAIGTVAGTGLSVAGNIKDQNAMNAARASEASKQAALQKQSNAIFQDSLAKSSPNSAQQQMEAGQTARQNAWQTLQDATTPTASALPTTSGTATKGAAQRAAGAAGTWNALNANAAAREGSYGDWENQQAIKNADASQKLGVVNNFSQSDAALLPTELQVASQAGDGLSGWGSIVSSLGNLAGYANKFGNFGKPTPMSQIGNYPGSAAMLNQPGLGVSNNDIGDIFSPQSAAAASSPAARFGNGGGIWANIFN